VLEEMSLFDNEHDIDVELLLSEAEGHEDQEPCSEDVEDEFITEERLSEETTLMEDIESIISEGEEFDDLMDDDFLDDEEDLLGEEGNGKDETGADGELGDKLSEDLGFDFVEPIAFSEDHVRLFPRGDKFLISESDFESVCYNYLGQKDGYQVLETIAESHNIDSDDIIIFLAEGEVQEPDVQIKKGKSKTAKGPQGITKSIKDKISKLNQQIATLPPSSPSAKAKRQQRKRLRAQLVLHSGK
jgi:hypothetical protein